LANDAYVSNED